MNATVSDINTRISKTVITGLVVAALSLGFFGGHAHAQDNDTGGDGGTPCHANGQEYPEGSLIMRGGKWYACVDGAWELQDVWTVSGGGGTVESNPGQPGHSGVIAGTSRAPVSSVSAH